ncbi:32597_t:CDS:2, partial [Racocetra persica]
SRLSKDYTILPKEVYEEDMKTIMLVDKYLKQLYNLTFAYIEYLGCSAQNGCHKDKYNWKGCISIFYDKLLNLYNIEYYRNHDPDHNLENYFRYQ